MSQPQTERRATRRFGLHLPLSVKHPQKGEITGHTRDVSSRGICFYLDAPMVAGTELEFTLTLPPQVTLSESIRVRCKARVVRVENAGDITLAVAAVIERYEFLGEQ